MIMGLLERYEELKQQGFERDITETILDKLPPDYFKTTMGLFDFMTLSHAAGMSMGNIEFYEKFIFNFWGIHYGSLRPDDVNSITHFRQGLINGQINSEAALHYLNRVEVKPKLSSRLK